MKMSLLLSAVFCASSIKSTTNPVTLPMMRKTEQGWIKNDRTLGDIFEEYKDMMQAASETQSQQMSNETYKKCVFFGIAGEVADRNNENSAVYDALYEPLLQSSTNKSLSVATDNVALNFKDLDPEYIKFFACFLAGYKLKAKIVAAKVRAAEEACIQ